MAAIFELKTNADGLYEFHFINSKGKMVLMSAEYESKSDAEKAIKEVRVGSLMSQQIAKGKTRDGDSFFVIKDSMGNVIAKSVLFDNEMVFDAALHSVKDNACVAEITEAA
ncbi:MAG: hypothetical protein MI976_07695 [Pseudomonadales bacterium]|nr:hypothetical protein [Pseudomonadales bacterium]